MLILVLTMVISKLPLLEMGISNGTLLKGTSGPPGIYHVRT